MALFNQLDDRFFAPLARGNTRLHERCLLAILKKFYLDNVEFPTKDGMLRILADVIHDNPDLWVEDIDELQDETQSLRSKRSTRYREDESLSKHPAIARARRVYRYLCDTGWFTEMVHGLQVHTELTPAAQSLMETLYRIHEGISEEMDGTLQTLNAVLAQLANGEDKFASGLASCLKQLREFQTSLRATRSDMARIRDEVLRGKTIGDRIDTLMEKFVNEILIKDLKRMMSDRHPYLMRTGTVAIIRGFMADRGKMRKIGEELASKKLTKPFEQLTYSERKDAIDAGVLLAEQQFAAIEECLDQIEVYTDAIMEAKSKLEEQLRVQARHQHRVRPEHERKVEDMIGQFGRLLAGVETPEELPEVPSLLVERSMSIHPKAFWEPFAPRKKIETVTSRNDRIDHLANFRAKLDDAFLKRIMPTDQVLRAFIEKALGSGNVVELGDGILHDIDDFIASSVILTLSRGDEIPPSIRNDYVIEPISEMISTRYAVSPGYRITRKTPQKSKVNV